MMTGMDLEKINQMLASQDPIDILKWAKGTFPTGLFQTTAFGPSGLVILHMLSTLNHLDPQVPLIFIDTLYHFNETLELSRTASDKYNVTLHTFHPLNTPTLQEFEEKYGSEAWKTKPDLYDYTVKSEPAFRAYQELGVKAVITGRRRSQKGDRAEIPIVEFDKSNAILKLNPLAFWDYDQVWAYIRANDVPYNVLHDSGYKSIGDHHSTKASTNGEERGGRWEGVQGKTECGLHKDYFEMRRRALEQEQQ